MEVKQWAMGNGQYDKLKKCYPDLLRSDYLLNNLIFPVILPLVIFAVLAWFMVYVR